MPELPEVQAHAERLESSFSGARLSRFEPLSFTVLRTFSPDPSDAIGRELSGVGRRGKLLLLRFDPLTFVVEVLEVGDQPPAA